MLFNISILLHQIWEMNRVTILWLHFLNYFLMVLVVHRVIKNKNLAFWNIFNGISNTMINVFKQTTHFLLWCLAYMKQECLWSAHIQSMTLSQTLSHLVGRDSRPEASCEG